MTEPDNTYHSPERGIPRTEIEVKPYLDQDDNLFAQFPFNVVRDELATPEVLKTNNLPEDLLKDDLAWSAIVFLATRNTYTDFVNIDSSTHKGKTKPAEQIVEHIPAGMFSDSRNRHRLELYATKIKKAIFEYPNMRQYIGETYSGRSTIMYNALGQRSDFEPENRRPSYLYYQNAHEELLKGGKWAGLDVELVEKGLATEADVREAIVKTGKGSENREYRLLFHSEGTN